MSQTVKIMVTLITLVSVTLPSSAQLYLGPKVDYSISTSVPNEVSQSGAPARFNLGLIASVPVRKSMELRIAGLYRIENGGITTTYVEESRIQPGGGTIQAIEPGQGGPPIKTTIETSSVELSAALYFPVADLDTSGATLNLGLGLLGDMVLSGSQVDDYSLVPEIGDSTASFTYASQIGVGALFGLGVTLPIGGDRLNFDMQFVFREPDTIPIENTNPEQEARINWLVGGGLRIGVSYQFNL